MVLAWVAERMMSASAEATLSQSCSGDRLKACSTSPCCSSSSMPGRRKGGSLDRLRQSVLEVCCSIANP